MAITTLSQAAIQKMAPGAVEEVVKEESKNQVWREPKPAIATPAQSQPIHPLHRLPAECPKCSGPIRGVEVRWTSDLSADCPYCGANLPLAKE